MNLPDFIICGAQKGGTTALLKYLKQHPQIYMPRQEMHFFSWYYDRGERWYAKHFRYNLSLCIYGEKSPSYMYLDAGLVAKRMHETMPSVKLIFMLRDPVKRAYSEYWMLVLNGEEKLPFNEAVWREDRDYLKRGFYAQQIREYLKYFGKENIMILISEDFRKNRERRMKEVFDFLGVEHIDLRTPDVHVGGMPRSKFLLRLSGLMVKLSKMAWDTPFLRNFFWNANSVIKEINKTKGKKEKMDEKTERKLYEYFAPYNDDLMYLLHGLNLPDLAEIIKKEWVMEAIK